MDLFKKLKEKYAGGATLIVSTMLANVLNFVFSIYLGRKLSLELFGELAFFTSLISLLSIPLGSYSSTIGHEIAYLYGKYSKNKARAYMTVVFRKSLLLSLVLSLFWIIASPFAMRYFNMDSWLPILLFAPLLVINFATSNISGYFAGTLSFGKKGMVLFTEAFVRLTVAIILISLGLSRFVFLSLIISLFFSLIVGLKLSKSKTKPSLLPSKHNRFNSLFFITSLVGGISVISFLTLDVVLVKHFLSPVEAGEYGILALIGKMTYFFGSLFGPFMIPIVAHNIGAKKSSRKTFISLFIVTLLFSVISFISLGLFGGVFVDKIFGSKVLPIVTYLPQYIFAMALFTVSQPFVSYFQAKKKYQYAATGILVASIQISFISIFHKNLQEVVSVMLWTSITNAVALFFTYIISNYLPLAKSSYLDFSGLFKKKENYIKSNVNGLRILIFNWRDTKHMWAGGAEVYVHEIAKRWVGQGNSVTLFCGNDRKNTRNEVIDGVNIVRRGGFYTVYLWAALYYILRFRRNFDVIIDSENGIPFFSPLFSTKPVILLIHHVHQEVFVTNMKFPLSYIGKFIEGKVMPLVYRNKTIVTVSESSKKEIIKAGIANESQIQIVNPGIFIERQRIKKSPFPQLIYLGRLKPYKNIDVAIRAFMLVLQKIKKATFLIVGEGESMRDLQDIVIKNELSVSIKFLGKVDEKEKLRLLSESWVAVQPSDVEGWGITVLEANACKTPVVASKTNGLKDSVVDGRTGILVGVRDTKGFSKAILHLMRNKERREFYSQNAYKWAKNFDWDEISTKFIEILSTDIENRKRAFRIIRTGYLLNRVTSLF